MVELGAITKLSLRKLAVLCETLSIFRGNKAHPGTIPLHISTAISETNNAFMQLPLPDLPIVNFRPVFPQVLVVRASKMTNTLARKYPFMSKLPFFGADGPASSPATTTKNQTFRIIVF